MNRKVGVLLVGMNGSTANTLILGSHLVRLGMRPNRGLLTSDTSFEEHDLVPAEDLVFGGWDLRPGDAYSVGCAHGILREADLAALEESGRRIRPWKAIHGDYDVELTSADTHVAAEREPLAQYEKVRAEIEGFRREHDVNHVVVGYVAAPLRKFDETELHTSEERFRQGIAESAPGITSAMIYALAAFDCECSFFDFTANATLEVPAIIEAASRNEIAYAGSDGRTGQTIVKSTLGEMLRIRGLRVVGWYSTNILGNNDGRVLTYPDHNERKMQGKVEVLAPVLGYDDFAHAVNITYYPPRGDNKEFWDNVDIAGWLDMPMTFKVNWMGRDSIMAGPVLLDVIRLLDLAHRRGDSGLQGQLDIFFKHPLGPGPHDGFNREYHRFVDHYASLPVREPAGVR